MYNIPNLSRINIYANHNDHLFMPFVKLNYIIIIIHWFPLFYLFVSIAYLSVSQNYETSFDLIVIVA